MMITSRRGFSCFVAVLFLVAVLLHAYPAHSYRAAIFDFDDRINNPDDLVRHIEMKLKDMFEGMVVDHYNGKSDEAYAVEVLSSIESKGYDLAIIRTSDALIIAQHTLFNTPTLYTNVNNPLLLGFKTLGPPGGNISGASYYIPIKKHLEVYKAIQPSLKKPGFIFDITNKSRKVEIAESREACGLMGLKFEMEFIESKDQLPRAVNALISRGVDAVIAASSGMIYENIGSIINITNREGIPVYSFYKTGVSQGALAALSSDFFRMADELLLPMAEKVLRHGISPGSMPAAFLEKNRLFINVKQSTILNLKIPRALENEYEVTLINN